MPLINPFEKVHRVNVDTEWFLLPESQMNDYLDNLMFTLGPDGAGTGRIETTTASRNSVESENENPSSQDDIMPAAWPIGNVSAITQESSLPVTAYRIIVVSGNLIVTVRGL